MLWFVRVILRTWHDRMVITDFWMILGYHHCICLKVRCTPKFDGWAPLLLRTCHCMGPHIFRHTHSKKPITLQQSNISNISNMAIDNPPFIDDFPISTSIFREFSIGSPGARPGLGPVLRLIRQQQCPVVAVRLQLIPVQVAGLQFLRENPTSYVMGLVEAW